MSEVFLFTDVHLELDTHVRIYETAKVTMDRSHIQEGRQFHYWLRHAMEPTIPTWPTRWSIQKPWRELKHILENR